MPSTTRLFGLILIVLGIASYVVTGRTSVTALIPAIFGAVFVICALVARSSSTSTWVCSRSSPPAKPGSGNKVIKSTCFTFT